MDNSDAIKFMLKATSSLGLALLSAALWWEYSEKMINAFFRTIGLG